MIECRRINKVFKSDILEGPTEVLKDVSFTIKKGETIGFLGANGAGKTTLIKTILGFIKATSGDILFDSHEMGNTREENLQNVGYLPERPYFYPHLKGREFLTLMGKLSRVEKVKFEQAISKWSQRLGIDFALDKQINSYSKGMLQRLGFVSTLIHDPKILIMDEPLSGLDPVGRREFKDVLSEVYRAGKTVFFSSHIVGDVEEICNQVVVLEKGSVVYDGLISDLIKTHSGSKVRFTVRGKVESLMGTSSNSFGNQSTSFLIEQDKKDNFLKEIINKDIDLINMSIENQTLEEVVYKIRKND
ncbi:MAG: ABC transporter ATP-binding protein [Bacteriovoracaceae bacterium]|nr:ABC transporter ATP-binding protein [Bacteriovoracaceae bacterium]